MSLNNFISEVKSGLSLNSHYQVFITRPDGMIFQNIFGSGFNNAHDKLSLFCEQANLPGLNISTIPIRTFGESVETPYEKIYHPINLSFYVDNKFIVKDFFDSWMNIIQSNTTRIHNFPSIYKSSVDIIMYDRKDNKRYMMTLYEAYPKNIGDIQLSYTSSEITKLPIEFTYKYYKTKTYSNNSINSDESTISNYLSNFIDFQSIASDTLSSTSGSIIRDLWL